ncbi:MAG: FAD synthetase family protein [Spirochaetes bacterium]|nr:FAD synthetase family protein [Spirochaetota bacterium]
MQIIEWNDFVENGLPIGERLSAVTVGVFDGVHRGHVSLIERVTLGGLPAGVPAGIPVIVTFRKNYKLERPLSAFPPGQNIVSFRQKCAIFESLGVAITVVADFSDSFRQMSGADFFRLLWERGRMGFLAVGSDFRCGRNLDTDAALIRQLHAGKGIPVEVADALMEDGAAISSSRIRKAIRQGNLKQAASMLGRPFTLDLGEAAALHGGSDCVLPPAGSYRVLLYEDGRPGKPAVLQIEDGGLVKISRDGFLPAGREAYAEFVS